MSGMFASVPTPAAPTPPPAMPDMQSPGVLAGTKQAMASAMAAGRASTTLTQSAQSAQAGGGGTVAGAYASKTLGAGA